MSATRQVIALFCPAVNLEVNAISSLTTESRIGKQQSVSGKRWAYGSAFLRSQIQEQEQQFSCVKTEQCARNKRKQGPLALQIKIHVLLLHIHSGATTPRRRTDRSYTSASGAGLKCWWWGVGGGSTVIVLLYLNPLTIRHGRWSVFNKLFQKVNGLFPWCKLIKEHSTGEDARICGSHYQVPTGPSEERLQRSASVQMWSGEHDP
ncbi:hypothetical protein Q8A73_001496 [Channa argus]|nr:hypothetical protein Q8A73_001496 [Channa argus]